MTAERWQRIKRIFDAALEQEESARQAFVASACEGDADLQAEVEAMLQADLSTRTFFEEPVITEARPDPLVGRRLGPYLIIRRIGRGGMGAVYLGQRADDEFRRRVAIKAVRPELVDEQTLRRFQNERQTMAVLDHPNIIKLLDGGTSEDGLPYLVMDYAEGQPIDQYCEQHKLTVNERLELFRTVCAAVHYAHQNLVVHRDLKPDNVLVTPDGTVKLLDFGIAKLLRPEYSASPMATRTHSQPMTPEYASPEQIMGKPVTTASDIYSLGVMLYRLLTGHDPYALKTSSDLALQKAICEVEPERPSISVLHHETGEMQLPQPEVASRLLRGDLDTIVLMAMRKEPQRRYASAEHLAEDIRRHLTGRPVLARKSTLAYRASKFITRHKPGTAAGAVALVLLAFLGWSAYSNYVRAQRRFDDLRKFANFAINDLDGAMRRGVTPAEQALVKKATQYLDGLAAEAGSDATLTHELITGYIKMGEVQGDLFQSNVGLPGEAEASYRKALGLAEQWHKRDPASQDAEFDIAEAQWKIGGLKSTGADRAEALRLYHAALSFYEGVPAANPAAHARARATEMVVLSRIAYVQGEMGDPGGALASFEKTLRLIGGLEDPQRKQHYRPRILERIAYFRALDGSPREAGPEIEEALELYRAEAGKKPTDLQKRDIAAALYTEALVKKLGRTPAEALASCRESLKMTEELLAVDESNQQDRVMLQLQLVMLIDLLNAAGRSAEARPATERALRILQPEATAAEAGNYPLQNYATILLTTPFADLRNDAVALRCAKRAVELTEESDPEALELLSRAQERMGQQDAALASAQKALALLPKPGATPSDIRRRCQARVAELKKRGG